MQRIKHASHWVSHKNRKLIIKLLLYHKMLHFYTLTRVNAQINIIENFSIINYLICCKENFYRNDLSCQLIFNTLWKNPYVRIFFVILSFWITAYLYIIKSFVDKFTPVVKSFNKQHPLMKKTNLLYFTQYHKTYI